MTISPAYSYHATVTNVVDGDTVDVVTDLGFGASLAMRLRLFAINAPEIVGPDRAAALAAEKWLSDAILGKRVVIETHKDRKGRDRKDKWSRYLAVIWLDGRNINSEMLNLGLAVKYE